MIIIDENQYLSYNINKIEFFNFIKNILETEIDVLKSDKICFRLSKEHVIMLDCDHNCFLNISKNTIKYTFCG